MVIDILDLEGESFIYLHRESASDRSGLTSWLRWHPRLFMAEHPLLPASTIRLLLEILVTLAKPCAKSSVLSISTCIIDWSMSVLCESSQGDYESTFRCP